MVLRSHPSFQKPVVGKTRREVSQQQFDRFEFMSNDELKAECRRLEGLRDETWLYEIVTPLLAKKKKDPVRVYAWTDSLPWGMEQAVRSFLDGGVGQLVIGDLKARRLFRRAQAPFVTLPAEGFGDFLFSLDDTDA